jgi:hypothetical protein
MSFKGFCLALSRQSFLLPLLVLPPNQRWRSTHLNDLLCVLASWWKHSGCGNLSNERLRASRSHRPLNGNANVEFRMGLCEQKTYFEEKIEMRLIQCDMDKSKPVTTTTTRTVRCCCIGVSALWLQRWGRSQ